MRNNPHQTEARNKVKPVAHLRDKLSREQIAEITIPRKQLAVGERGHRLRINGFPGFAKNTLIPEDLEPAFIYPC
jgi:hypothetical protein